MPKGMKGGMRKKGEGTKKPRPLKKPSLDEIASSMGRGSKNPEGKKAGKKRGR